jgi:chromosome segregation ATPase
MERQVEKLTKDLQFDHEKIKDLENSIESNKKQQLQLKNQISSYKDLPTKVLDKLYSKISSLKTVNEYILSQPSFKNKVFGPIAYLIRPNNPKICQYLMKSIGKNNLISFLTIDLKVYKQLFEFCRAVNVQMVNIKYCTNQSEYNETQHFPNWIESTMDNSFESDSVIKRFLINEFCLYNIAIVNGQ